MKLEDIEKEWSVDSIINNEDLSRASLDIPKLHSKYYNILLAEKKMLYVLSEKKAILEDQLEGWFLKTMTTEERIEAGLPDFPNKKYLKSNHKKTTYISNTFCFIIIKLTLSSWFFLLQMT